MPITYDIDTERRLALTKVSGEFTADDIREAISGAVADPRFEPGFDILSDHTEITRAISPQQVRQMVAHLSTLSRPLGQSRMAVVANQPASYGMIRMLSVYAEEVPLEIGVFATRAEALDWLGRPADPE